MLPSDTTRSSTYYFAHSLRAPELGIQAAMCAELSCGSKCSAFCGDKASCVEHCFDVLVWCGCCKPLISLLLTQIFYNAVELLQLLDLLIIHVVSQGCVLRLRNFWQICRYLIQTDIGLYQNILIFLPYSPQLYTYKIIFKLNKCNDGQNRRQISKLQSH